MLVHAGCSGYKQLKSAENMYNWNFEGDCECYLLHISVEVFVLFVKGT